jgi:hypothetical protein
LPERPCFICYIIPNLNPFIPFVADIFTIICFQIIIYLFSVWNISNPSRIIIIIFKRYCTAKKKTLCSSFVIQFFVNQIKQAKNPRTVRFNMTSSSLYKDYGPPPVCMRFMDRMTTCNRKSTETRSYLICTRGRSPRVLIRLPSVLVFFLFCIIVKHKSTFPVVTKWNPGKNEPMNEHLNMTFLSLSLSLPSQYVNPSKNEPINGHALECG